MVGTLPTGPESRRRRSLPPWVRALLWVALVPGLLLAAMGVSRGGLCLEAYQWEDGAGWAPVPAACDSESTTPPLRTLGFYGRMLGGLFTGEPGRSREDAARPWTAVLAPRLFRSAGILAVAMGVLATALLIGRGTGGLPRALPLPIAGYGLFVLVVRLTPAGSWLDYDRAGTLWAGLSLGVADGLAASMVGGLASTLRREEGRPYAVAMDLSGGDGRDAARTVAAPERAAILRGAVLGLLGGLPVVESIFAVQGLGETVRDVVVDRRGLDPVLLAATLLLFGLAIAGLVLLPWERLARRLA